MSHRPAPVAARHRSPAAIKRARKLLAEEAAIQVLDLLNRGLLTPDQLIRVAREWDPADRRQAVDLTLTVEFE